MTRKMRTLPLALPARSVHYPCDDGNDAANSQGALIVFRKWISTIVVLAAIAAPASALAQAKKPAAAVRTVTITAGDPIGAAMEYSLKQIVVKPGEQIRVRLVSTSQMPKAVMAHNWVLLKAKTNVQAFIDKAATARATDFIAPAQRASILAIVELVGQGERLEVTFTAPSTPGSYDYVCTFAGHFAAGMAGKLIVK